MRTADTIVRVLNEMLAADPAATHALVGNRVPCNAALAEHDTVQVAARGEFYLVGLLGVINGIAATDGGLVRAVFDTETSLILRFEALRTLRKPENAPDSETMEP